MFRFDRIQQKLLLIMGAVIILFSGVLVYRKYGHRTDPSVDVVQLWQNPDYRAQQSEAQMKGVQAADQPPPASSVEQGKSVEGGTDEKVIQVYVTGQVQHKGLITLSEGDRVADAIELAGGALPEADLNRINLALRVRDEDMIYVPALGEEIPSDTSGLIANNTTGREIKVNINQADQALLETLTGIGPAKARKIIEYRDMNGGFKTIEEVMNVSGIGEKTFEGLKDHITIK